MCERGGNVGRHLTPIGDASRDPALVDTSIESPPGTGPRPRADPRPQFAAREGCSRTATPPRHQRRPREGGCAKSRLNRCRSFSRTSMPLLPSPALRPPSSAAHPGHSKAEAFIAYPRKLRCPERPVKGPRVIAVRRAPKDLAVVVLSARIGCLRKAAAPRLVQPLHHAPTQPLQAEPVGSVGRGRVPPGSGQRVPVGPVLIDPQPEHDCPAEVHEPSALDDLLRCERAIRLIRGVSKSPSTRTKPKERWRCPNP